MATAKKAKPKETAGYCKTAELARLFGESAQWIGQLTRDGILKKHKTAAGERYNTVEATQSYVQHLKDKAYGREAKKTAKEKELERFEADIAIKQAKATIAQLEAAELEGKMHRSEDVAAMTDDLVYAVRGTLLALPGRVAVDVSATSTAAEAAEVIRAEIYKLMKELAEHRYDPKKYQERVRERKSWDMENWDDE